MSSAANDVKLVSF